MTLLIMHPSQDNIKMYVRARTGFVWLRIRTSGGLSSTRQWTFLFHKWWPFFFTGWASGVI